MNYFIIFLASVFICTLALLFEQAIGINWDFHPDAVNYVTVYNDVVSSSILALPNQLYFYIAYVAKGNISVLIALNILAFSITNLIFFKEYSSYSKVFNKKSLVYLFLLIFTPYRIHLAIHVLKDTLVILFFTLIVGSKKIRLNSILLLTSLFLMRVYSLIYFSLFFRIRLLLLSLLTLFILMAFFDIALLDFILERNFAEMHNRAFDTIPSFSDFGLMGTLTRMVVWPVLLISGYFIVLAPNLFFAPIFLEIIATRLWSWRFLRSAGLNLNLIFCLALISALVNSFTAFLRYAYPLLVVMPIILMQNRIDLLNAKSRFK
jgi:hypothetical protein